jgi:hypothetical protein
MGFFRLLCCAGEGCAELDRKLTDVHKSVLQAKMSQRESRGGHVVGTPETFSLSKKRKQLQCSGISKHLIGDVEIDTEEFHDTLRHKKLTLMNIRVREFAVPYVCEVHSLVARLDKRMWHLHVTTLSSSCVTFPKDRKANTFQMYGGKPC